MLVGASGVTVVSRMWIRSSEKFAPESNRATKEWKSSRFDLANSEEQEINSGVDLRLFNLSLRVKMTMGNV